MSIQRYNGAGFSEIADRRRFDGSKWNELAFGRRFDGREWVELWSNAEASVNPKPASAPSTAVRTFALKSAQIYWGSGRKDNQTKSANDLIVGSYGGGCSTARRTLLFFPLETIQSELEGASVVKVELYLHRRNTSHGSAGGSLLNVKTAVYTSAPDSWDGSDSGGADGATPSFKRGEGKWIPLLDSVGTGLISGSLGCLALDADGNYGMAAYGRYVRRETKLRITYKL